MHKSGETGGGVTFLSRGKKKRKDGEILGGGTPGVSYRYIKKRKEQLFGILGSHSAHIDSNRKI